MSVLDRLKFHHPNFKSAFDASIHQSEQLQILLNEQPALALEYDAVCIRLVALLNECNLHPDSILLKTCLQSTLKEARQLNKHLLYLYTHSSTFAGAKNRLKQHQDKLTPSKISSDELKTWRSENESTPANAHSSVIQWIKGTFSTFLEWLKAKINKYNIIRLFFARLRRGLVNVKSMISVFTTNSTFFKTIFDPFDKYFFGPAINFLAWIFILPRLLVNMFFTAWRVIHHDGLSTEAKALNWKQRLFIEWRERWFEFANDFIWVPGNILLCFVLIGSLNMVGLILGVAMFGWDVVLSVTRAIIDLVRLNKLINHHTEHLGTLTDPAEISNQTDLIKQLKAQRSYEIKRHGLNIVTNMAVTLLSFFAVSIIVFPPIVPIIASILLLIVTITWIYLNQRISSIKPDSKLESLNMTSYDTLLKTMPADECQPEVLPAQSDDYTPRSPVHHEPTSQFQFNPSGDFS